MVDILIFVLFVATIPITIQIGYEIGKREEKLNETLGKKRD